MLKDRASLVSTRCCHLIVGATLMGTLLAPSAGMGEFYVGGQLGAQVANAFGDVATTDGPPGINLTDLDLKHSVLFGAKAGYFLPQFPYLGIEVRASHAKPNLEPQVSLVGGPVPGIAVFERMSLRVMTVAVNLIVRAQLQELEPYAGMGLGIFFAQLKDPTGASQSDNGVPGFSALAGYRYFVTKDRRMAFGVEYTYERARLSFDNVLNPSLGIGTGISGDYEAHAVIGGLSYHFR